MRVTLFDTSRQRNSSYETQFCSIPRAGGIEQNVPQNIDFRRPFEPTLLGETAVMKRNFVRYLAQEVSNKTFHKILIFGGPLNRRFWVLGNGHWG